MDAFNFVFTLFGLLLGLSLAEVLGGFVRAVKRRRLAQLGRLTPLLAFFVMLDLVSFWQWIWGARDYLSPGYGVMFVGLVVSSLYYLAASIVFPDEADSSEDFDSHYMKRHRQVLGAIMLCNLIGQGWAYVMLFDKLPTRVLIELSLYYLLLFTAIATQRPRLNLMALIGLIAIYLFSAVMSFVHPVSA